MVRETSCAYVEQVLGPYETVGDLTSEHQASYVGELRDAEGRRWFVKRHQDRDRYEAEVAAYRRWVPALGERAPRLHAHEDDLRTVILSAVPGEPATRPAGDTGTPIGVGPEVQHDAGVRLRLLHDAGAALAGDDFGAAKIDEFEHWARRAAGLLAPRETGFAREAVSALAALDSPRLVPSTSNTRGPTCGSAISSGCTSEPGTGDLTCATPSSTDTGAASATPTSRSSSAARRSPPYGWPSQDTNTVWRRSRRATARTCAASWPAAEVPEARSVGR
jgi:hypothetical protein